jgi:hypothetical protein
VVQAWLKAKRHAGLRCSSRRLNHAITNKGCIVDAVVGAGAAVNIAGSNRIKTYTSNVIYKEIFNNCLYHEH